jgi:DNA modification methylase
VAQIAASIREWGWTNPVLIDEAGGIIAGHGRVMAARKLKIEDVPCIVATGWTDAQKRAYVLADNQLAANAGWDMDLLKVEIGDLKTEGFDVGLIGFDADWLNTLMADPGTDGLTDPDEVPETPLNPVTVAGDVWQLGRHRLLCGDSTVATDVDKVLMGVRPLLMVTDPPYGVEYDPKWRLEAGINKAHQKRAEGIVRNDDRSDWREAWALFPGEVAYVWHGALHAANVADSLASSGFSIRSQIIWAKKSLVMGRGHYHWQHEPCWYAVKESGKGHWAGDRKQSTLWEIPNMHRTQGNVDDGKTNHSTQKPVECMKRPIENNSTPGQAVYEPFSGSGTTIIAAEMTGRQCLAIELAPEYVDVAVKRWQAFTGKEATLDGTDQTFNEIQEARHVPA